jgi:hypothetical protein
MYNLAPVMEGDGKERWVRQYCRAKAPVHFFKTGPTL